MSLNLFSRLMPAKEAFTPLFREQAERIVQAAEQLRQMIGEETPAERQKPRPRTIHKCCGHGSYGSSGQ
jgi:hypothetical protein